MVVAGGLIERFHHIVADGGLYNGFQAVAHCDGAPRGFSWQGDACKVGTKTIVLAFIRISNGIAYACLIVGEMSPAVVGAHTCLGNEYPRMREVEEGREDVTMAIL